MKNGIAVAILVALFCACGGYNKEENNTSSIDSTQVDSEAIRNKEAREDSTKLAEALALQSQVEWSIQAVVETKPVAEGAEEDAADDPAFWLNALAQEESIVFGTNKKGGIYAYDLKGNEMAYYEVGEVNNIDIRQGILVGQDTIDVIGGSNRSDNSIVLYQIDSMGQLQPLLETNFTIDSLDIDEVYGFCLHKDQNGRLHALVNGKNGQINSYALSNNDGRVELNKTRSWKLMTQPEGMVADDQNGTLYIGEEEKGIWKTSLNGSEELELIESSLKDNNEFIAYDIEGLSMYVDPSGVATEGFLVASIQGSFSYALFERKGNNQYIGSFKIVASNTIDGVEETDGLEIVSIPVGASFPKGMLIVQDGFNTNQSESESQNFKLVDLSEVLQLLDKDN